METNNRPLYEEDQVVTYIELMQMMDGCLYQYSCTHWWNYIQRLKIRSALGCLHAMLSWMKNGKPTVRLNQGE